MTGSESNKCWEVLQIQIDILKIKIQSNEEKYQKAIEFIKDLTKYDYSFVSTYSQIGKAAKEFLKEIGEL